MYARVKHPSEFSLTRQVLWPLSANRNQNDEQFGLLLSFANSVSNEAQILNVLLSVVPLYRSYTELVSPPRTREVSGRHLHRSLWHVRPSDAVLGFADLPRFRFWIVPS